MTETPKSAARLLAEIRRLLRLPAAAEIPGELYPGQLAALMAGCRKSECKEKYESELQMVFDGIRSNRLAVRREERKPKVLEKWVPDYRTYGGPFGEGPHLRQTTVTTPRSRIDWISPHACVAWLNAINEQPPELVREWLGPAWQGEAPKVGIGKTATKKRSAADSRPREREAYFRALWLEFDMPRTNHKIWAAIKQRRNSDGCSVIAVTGDVDFTFRYADGGTDLLQRIKFQQDMSAVRAAERKG